MTSNLWQFAVPRAICTYTEKKKQYIWIRFEDIEEFVSKGGTPLGSKLLMQDANDILFLWRQVFIDDDRAFCRIVNSAKLAIVDRICWTSKRDLERDLFALIFVGRPFWSPLPWNSQDTKVLAHAPGNTNAIWLAQKNVQPVSKAASTFNAKHFVPIVKKYHRKVDVWDPDVPGVAFPFSEVRKTCWNEECFWGNHWETASSIRHLERIITMLCDDAGIDPESPQLQIECNGLRIKEGVFESGDLIIATSKSPDQLQRGLAHFPMPSSYPIPFKLPHAKAARVPNLPLAPKGTSWISIYTGHDLLSLAFRLDVNKIPWFDCFRFPSPSLLPDQPLSHEEKQQFLKRFLNCRDPIFPESAEINPKKASPKKPITDAQPPPFLTDLTQSAKNSSSKVLKNGQFCGHGESAFSVFDIAIEKSTDLQVAIFKGKSKTQDPQLLLARLPNKGTRWLTIFNQKWFAPTGEINLPAAPQWLDIPPGDPRINPKNIHLAQLSIGFEFPIDSQDPSDISWLTVDAWPSGHKGKPVVLVDVETA